MRSLAILSLPLLFQALPGCQESATRELPTVSTPSIGAQSVVGLPKTVPLPGIFKSHSSSPVVSSSGLTEQEQLLLDATNELRVRQNLRPLRPNLELCEVARAHAARMAKARNAAAVVDGRSLPKEIEAAAPNQSYAIAMGYSPLLDGPMIMASWLKEPDIRNEMLSDAYQEAGIGIARDSKRDWYYFVEIFHEARR